jgi:hypothetical protein
MTADAESHQIIFQEMNCFARSVWIMTVDASFLHRIMLKFYFRNGTGNILVTVKTEFIPRLKEREPIIGGVGVMAFYTIAFYNNLMTASRILRHDSFMALKTDLIRIFVQ